MVVPHGSPPQASAMAARADGQVAERTRMHRSASRRGNPCSAPVPRCDCCRAADGAFRVGQLPSHPPTPILFPRPRDPRPPSAPPHPHDQGRRDRRRHAGRRRPRDRQARPTNDPPVHGAHSGIFPDRTFRPAADVARPHPSNRFGFRRHRPAGRALRDHETEGMSPARPAPQGHDGVGLIMRPSGSPPKTCT